MSEKIVTRAGTQKWESGDERSKAGRQNTGIKGQETVDGYG